MTNIALETEAVNPGSPAYRGLYRNRIVALYIRANMPGSLTFADLNSRHIARWMRAGLGTDEYRQDFYLPGHCNFLDLISFRMVAAMRAGGISGRAIKVFHSALQEGKGWPVPFAMRPVWEGKPEVFRRLPGVPKPVKDFRPFGEGCHGLTFDGDGLAEVWSPAPGVALDPRRATGKPCIAGSRTPTYIFRHGYEAGESLEYQAEGYARTVAEVVAAIAWEKKVAEFC